MQNKTTLKQRLAEFLAYLKMGQAKFAESVGLSKGFANNVGDSIRTENLQKISMIYPDLNLTWLLTGEGEMIKSSVSVNQRIGRIDNNHGAVVGHNAGQITTGKEEHEISAIIAENARLKEDNATLKETNQKLLDQIFKLTDRLLDRN